MCGTDFYKELHVYILETIDFQNNPSREPKINWQILVNIFRNLDALQQRCSKTRSCKGDNNINLYLIWCLWSKIY